MLQRSVRVQNLRYALLASLTLVGSGSGFAQTAATLSQSTPAGTPLRSLLAPAPVTPTFISPATDRRMITRDGAGAPRINRYVDLHQYDQSQPTRSASTPAYTLAQHDANAEIVERSSQGQVRRNPLIADVAPKLRQFHVDDRQLRIPVDSNHQTLSGALVVRDPVMPERIFEDIDEVVDVLSDVDSSDVERSLGEARSTASHGGFGMLAIDQLGSHLPMDESLPIEPTWDRDRLATDLVPLPKTQLAMKATHPSDADSVAGSATQSPPSTDWLNPRKNTADLANVIRSQTVKPDESTGSSNWAARATQLETTELEELNRSTPSRELLVTSERLPLLPAPNGQADRGDVRAFLSPETGPRVDRLFSEASGAFGLDQHDESNRRDESDADEIASLESASGEAATPTRLVAREPHAPIGAPATSPTLAQRFSIWTKRLGPDQASAQPVSTPIEQKQKGIFSHFLRRSEPVSRSGR
ncbi:hypothetical protein U8335_12890 [Roseiconus lacunae]|uniref:hypothetical protein n=1 Tax=Roseiconus lacunae TaxID=2605694 RepID=UPI003092A6C1|nr:hypothetical protein U8335_12890 [Stieleria sp. HD01]